MKIKNSQAGFTLIELLVVMVVMATVSLAVTNFIANWLEEASIAQSRTDLLQNAEGALDTISSDIKLSSNVDANNRWQDTYSPSGFYGWTSGAQTLVLAKAAVDSSNSIIWSDPAHYISQKDNVIYFLSSGTLYRRILKSTNASDTAVTTCPASAASASCPVDKTIAVGVTSLTFTYYDTSGASVTPTNARSVQISITLNSGDRGQNLSATYTTRMVFRNQ